MTLKSENPIDPLEVLAEEGRCYRHWRIQFNGKFLETIYPSIAMARRAAVDLVRSGGTVYVLECTEAYHQETDHLSLNFLEMKEWP
jgi:hypothetical protein